MQQGAERAAVEAELPRICAAVFGAGARASRCEDLTSGAESHVFALDVELPSGGAQRVVLKLYTSAETAAHEAKVMRALRTQGFPVPEVLHAEPAGDPLGRAYNLLQRIEGRTLGAVMREARGEDPARWLLAFAELAARLHGLDAAPFAPARSAGEHLDVQLARYAKAMHELEVPEFQPLFTWLEEQRRGLQVLGPALIHHDYHPFNVIVDTRGELYLIDWTISHVTDPRCDLAQTFQMLASSGFAALRAPITAAYEAASGRALADMAFFDVFATLKNVAGQYAVLDDGERKRPALWARLSLRPHFAQRAARLRAASGELERTYLYMKELSGVAVPEAERLFASLRAKPPAP